MSRNALSSEAQKQQLVFRLDGTAHVIEFAPRILNDWIFCKFRDETQTVAKQFGDAYRRLGGLEELLEGIDRVVISHLTKLAESAVERLRTDRILEYGAEELIRWAGNERGEDYEGLKDDVAEYLEQMSEETAAKDANRTARRQSRGRLVGFGSEGIVKAGLGNAATGAAHGLFNLIGKGMTAMGNSMKKQARFKELQEPFEHAFFGLAIGIYDAMAAAYRDHNIAVDSAQHVMERKKKAAVVMENGLKAGYDRQGLFGVAQQSLQLFCYDNEPALATLLQSCASKDNSLPDNVQNLKVLSNFMADQGTTGFRDTSLVDEKYVLLLDQLIAHSVDSTKNPAVSAAALDQLFQWNHGKHDALKLQTGLQWLTISIDQKKPLEENLRILRLVSPQLKLQRELTQAEEALPDEKYQMLLEQIIAASPEQANAPAILQELGPLFHWNRRNHDKWKAVVAYRCLSHSVNADADLEQNLGALKRITPLMNARQVPTADELRLLDEKYLSMVQRLIAALASDTPEAITIEQLDDVFVWNRSHHGLLKAKAALPILRGAVTAQQSLDENLRRVNRISPYLPTEQPPQREDLDLLAQKYLLMLEQAVAAALSGETEVTTVSLIQRVDTYFQAIRPRQDYLKRELAGRNSAYGAILGIAGIDTAPIATPPLAAAALAPIATPPLAAAALAPIATPVRTTVAAIPAANPPVPPPIPVPDSTAAAPTATPVPAPKVRWYFWKLVILPLLVLFFLFPFPLLLLWRSPVTRLSGRIVWSLLMGLVILPFGPVFIGIYLVFLALGIIFRKPPARKVRPD